MKCVSAEVKPALQPQRCKIDLQLPEVLNARDLHLALSWVALYGDDVASSQI
jgi:hypothetical protein